MEHLQAYNKKLLSNILPVHVADFFMSGDKNNDVRGADVCPWVDILTYSRFVLEGHRKAGKDFF